MRKREVIITSIPHGVRYIIQTHVEEGLRIITDQDSYVNEKPFWDTIRMCNSNRDIVYVSHLWHEFKKYYPNERSRLLMRKGTPNKTGQYTTNVFLVLNETHR